MKKSNTVTSIHMPKILQNQLTDSRSDHLKKTAEQTKQGNSINPYTALRGLGNKKYTTDQIMRMTRGDD